MGKREAKVETRKQCVNCSDELDNIIDTDGAIKKSRCLETKMTIWFVP